MPANNNLELQPHEARNRITLKSATTITEFYQSCKKTDIENKYNNFQHFLSSLDETNSIKPQINSGRINDYSLPLNQFNQLVNFD